MKKILLSLFAIVAFVFNSNAQEAVDLGLSVKWASYNVGAISPEEVGGLFVCGTTEIWDKNLNKKDRVTINHNFDYSGDPAYDVATAFWGNEWRTPTKEEWIELINNCQREKIKLTTTKGIKISGLQFTGPNGNSIFLPYTYSVGGKLISGYYSCSTPVEDSKYQYVFECFPYVIVQSNRGLVDMGFATRAVCNR